MLEEQSILDKADIVVVVVVVVGKHMADLGGMGIDNPDPYIVVVVVGLMVMGVEEGEGIQTHNLDETKTKFILNS